MHKHQTRVAGIRFDNVTIREAVDRIAEMASQRDRPRHVCTGNLDHLALLDRDEAFRNVYDTADLVLADGMPVVWLSRLSGEGRLHERVAGSDLFWELVGASGRAGLRIFLLGGAPGAAEMAAAEATRKFPGACICGTYCPPFVDFGTDAEEAKIEREVRAANPNVLLVAFGSPKQELWIASKKGRLGVPISIGVGASFEMAAGVVKRAPKWIQSRGFEWLYRLLQEPGRLWRRYLGRDVPFLAGLAARSLWSRGPFARRPAQAE